MDKTDENSFNNNENNLFQELFLYDEGFINPSYLIRKEDDESKSVIFQHYNLYQEPIKKQELDDLYGRQNNNENMELYKVDDYSNYLFQNEEQISGLVNKKQGKKKKLNERPKRISSHSQDTTSSAQTATIKQLLFENDYTNHKKVRFDTYLVNKHLYEQKLFKRENKFYLFGDQVIDLDSFSNFDRDEEYQLKQRYQVQLHKGMRFINEIIHRVDNKYIQVNLEFFPSQLNNIEYLIEILKSIGNQNIVKTIPLLQQLWQQIKNYKQLIKTECTHPLLLQHYDARKKASDEKYQKIISQLPQNEMIYFLRVAPNYSKLLYESQSIGYSPQLYEILAQNSYQFHEVLQNNGCYDPRSIIFNLIFCLQQMTRFLSETPQQEQGKNYHEMDTDLITCDNFILPVKEHIYFIPLNQEYDAEHNLKFRFQEILIFHKFKFKDPNTEEYITKFRNSQDTGFSSQSTQNNNQSKEEQQPIEEEKQKEFIRKHYADSVSDLCKKGSKWLKKCGFIDIPKKQKK